MSIEEIMEKIVIDEEHRLGIGSSEFIQRHNEIMEASDRELLQDLAMEQRETV